MAAARNKRKRTRRPQSKRTGPRSWAHRLTAGLLGFRLLRTALLITLFLVTWVALNYQHLRELSRVNGSTRQLQEQAEGLTAQNTDLRRLRDALASSDNREVIERLAREEELLTYEGEVLVYIERPETD